MAIIILSFHTNKGMSRIMSANMPVMTFSALFQTGSITLKVLPKIETKGLTADDVTTLSEQSFDIMQSAFLKISGQTVQSNGPSSHWASCSSRTLSFAPTRMAWVYVIIVVVVMLTMTARRFSILSDVVMKQEHMSIQTDTHTFTGTTYSRCHLSLVLISCWTPGGAKRRNGSFFWRDALFHVIFDVGSARTAFGATPENIVDVRSTCMPFLCFSSFHWSTNTRSVRLWRSLFLEVLCLHYISVFVLLLFFECKSIFL